MLSPNPDLDAAARYLAETASDGIVGCITLIDRKCKITLPTSNGTVTTILRNFKVEQDRLEALRLYYGIEFSDVEREGVIDTAVSLDRGEFF